MILHVFPEAEADEHERAGFTCRCLPGLVLLSTGTIVSHRAYIVVVSREAPRPPAPFQLPLDPDGE